MILLYLKLFRDYITESFKKEYGYKVKLAANCTAEHLSKIESCLQKYNLVSATPFKRTPIQENPMEFVRYKGVQCTSEVCSSDIVLKYPVNERILEVWLAVNLGLDHSRVLCYGMKEPRRLEAESAAARVAADADRQVTEEDAALAHEELDHYAVEDNESIDVGFGEEHNARFLKELQRIKNEKGSDYFRNYPSKDEIMGDYLRPLHDTLHNQANMGRGQEGKEVDVIDQASNGKA